jgi:hypothetical protein
LPPLQDHELVAQDQDLGRLPCLLTPRQPQPGGRPHGQEKENRRHMTGDHHGRTSEKATLLVRAADEILGTHRHNYDMTALAETETADIIAAACSGIGDKGYQCSDFITPFKKPQGGELLDWQKEFNAQVNKLRAPIAHLKSWRILHTDYRRPLRIYVMSYRATVGLYFFKLNFE